jgi:hypothetical protein
MRSDPVAKWLFPVLRRLWAFFERRAIPDPSLAGVAGELEILSQFQSISWARIFAESTEHAAAQVVGEVGEFLAARFLIALARDHNEMFRTRQCTEVTRDAHRLVSIRIDVQTRGPAITLGDLRSFERILLGIDFFGILVAECDLQPLEKINQEHFAEQAWHPHMRVAYHAYLPSAEPCGGLLLLKAS